MKLPIWLLRWVDSYAESEGDMRHRSDRIDWRRCAPFIGLHLACLTVVWTGWSAIAVGAAVAMYIIRLFAITGFYHRYFSHRTFRTSRGLQAAMAWIGCTSVQRDPMWWASHHTHHHAHSDDPEDLHSPGQRGFLRSHIGWFMTPAAFPTLRRHVRDWEQFPEICFLNRFDWVPPMILAAGLFLAGEVLALSAPRLETNGWQMLVWGFFVSTVVLYHATFTVNSIAHGWGRRRYETPDDSRNNWLIAFLTLGEGWHNNHHRYPGSARQGFFWWEIDLTYYVLLLLAQLGFIWDLRPVPAHVLVSNPGDVAAWGTSR